MRRAWLAPLVPLYRAALWLRGAPRAKRLQWPVVSVGSLSAGGAGKTPVVKALAEMLAGAGHTVDVLTRGYGRASSEVARVTGEDAARFGDEAVLLSRAAPVFVGADRFAAGSLAEREDGARVHLLDDGFQHRRLARAMDVVLLTQEDMRDTLLPGGNLREPLSALARADAMVVREEEAAALTPWTAGHAVWVVRRVMQVQTSARPLAFCGLARPEDFFAGLRAVGVRAVKEIRFRDHHRYTGQDVDHLIARAKHAGADGFVTTEKDAVKLTESVLVRMAEVGPVAVAELRVEFAEPERVLRAIEERLK